MKTKLFIAFILLSSAITYSESFTDAINNIKQHKNSIYKAANTFHIPPRLLASVICTERFLNYTWEDDAFDKPAALLGYNCSIGFCQIRVNTAEWIIECLDNPKSVYFLGANYTKVFRHLNSRKELVLSLTNDETNILFAAAYIKVIINRWNNEGFPIDGKPDLVGTLYSGGPRKPSNSININNFGELTQELFSQLNL